MASTALSNVKEQLNRTKALVRNLREGYSEQIEEAAGVAVAVGAGVAFGAAEEYWGEDALFGTSLPMVGGLVLTGAALAGYGGNARMLMLEAGKAGLVIEAYKGGSRIMRDWQEGDGERTGDGGGALPPTGTP